MALNQLAIILVFVTLGAFCIGLVQFFRGYSGPRPTPSNIVSLALLDHFLNAIALANCMAIFALSESKNYSHNGIFILLASLAIIWSGRMLVTKKLQREVSQNSSGEII